MLLGIIGSIFDDGSENKKEQTQASDSTSVTEKRIGDADSDVLTWAYNRSMDEMTETENVWASLKSDNYIEQGFPYEGESYATITVRYMKKYGNDVILRIDKGQIVGIDVSGTNYVTAKFDDGEPKKYYFDDPADMSTEQVFLRNAKDFIKKCKTAKVIKVDIPLYQAGKPVFTFHVDKPLEWDN